MRVEDHLGRQVDIPVPPKRVVSICPAITETLFSLGLEQEIVGRTRYCIYPQNLVEQVTIVGGTKEVDYDVIASLQPDLIIAEKEENTIEIIEELEAHFPVFVFQIESIAEAYRMILDAGKITGRQEESKKLVEEITGSFQPLPQNHGRAAYAMWRKPYMVVGATTYISDVLQTLGFANPYTTYEGRYPVVDIAALQKEQLDVLFLSSEPFPFSQKHKDELAAYLPNTSIRLIDGEMFWYGARMKEAGHYFKQYFT
ncbi:ABC transporter substrate-binding protein [Lysinibacillus sp. 54212]|uniref:ABC transporter substrate-binding protein n=1 Tax=Lysinibacillus sp. 54212 TaxID=3119829 RepID=UPI002FCB25E9